MVIYAGEHSFPSKFIERDRVTLSKVTLKGDPLIYLLCNADLVEGFISIRLDLSVDGVKVDFQPETEFEDCLPAESLKGLAVDVSYLFSPLADSVASEIDFAISDFVTACATIEIIRESYDNHVMVAIYLKVGSFKTRALFPPNDLQQWLSVERRVGEEDGLWL